MTDPRVPASSEPRPDTDVRDGDWRCLCGDLNREHEACCFRCGGGNPAEPMPEEPFFTDQQERNLARCEAYDRASEPRPENPHGRDEAVKTCCSTMGHEELRAVRMVSCEGEGAFPYCEECAEVLLRGGEHDAGPSDDPVVAELAEVRAAFDAVVAERDEARRAYAHLANIATERLCRECDLGQDGAGCTCYFPMTAPVSGSSEPR